MKTDSKQPKRKRGYELLRRMILVQRFDLATFYLMLILCAGTVVLALVKPPQVETGGIGSLGFIVLGAVATIMVLLLSMICCTTGGLMREIHDLKDDLATLKGDEPDGGGESTA